MLHVALLLSCPAPVSTATQEANPVSVPIQLARNQVRLSATLNGKGPFVLVLDTGMPTEGVLLFGGPRVDALELGDSGARAALGGAGGSGDSRAAVVAQQRVAIGLGELELPHVPAMVLPDHAGLPPTVDGIIGGLLFDRFAVRLDFDECRMQLLESASWQPAPDTCVLPLIRVPGATFLDVHVAVGDGPPIRARVVIDLGAGHALSLNERPDGTFAPPDSAIETAIGRGLSGVVRGHAGRLRRLEIGPYAFEDVLATFPVAEHRHPGGFDFRDGNLGAEILKRFEVTFDYRGRRFGLAPGKRFGEPFERDMSGLTLQWLENGTLSVQEVLVGSPAAEAGIEPGDLLLGIGERSLDALGEGELRDALTIDGAEVELRLQRGTEVLEKRLRLRRLV